MEPAFIPGFRASVDYYNINIKGAIANLGRQETMDECYLRNNQTACDNITIVAGTNYRIDLPNLNLDALKLSGIDFKIDYRLPFLGGQLGLSALANYQWTFARPTPGWLSITRPGEAGLSANPKRRAPFHATNKTRQKDTYLT